MTSETCEQERMRDDLLIEVKEAIKEQTRRLLEIDKILSGMNVRCENEIGMVRNLANEIWGSDRDPGLKTKVDRLVQEGDRVKFWIKSLVVSVISLLANLIYKGFVK